MTGDMGTSPLYVFTGIFTGQKEPDQEDVVGAASCIVLSLTLVPLIKYSWIVLRASNDKGEGIHLLILNNGGRDAGIIHAVGTVASLG